MTLEARYVAMARKHETAAIQLERDAERCDGAYLKVHIINAAKTLRQLALVYVARAEEARRERQA